MRAGVIPHTIAKPFFTQPASAVIVLTCGDSGKAIAVADARTAAEWRRHVRRIRRTLRSTRTNDKVTCRYNVNEMYITRLQNLCTTY